MRPAPSLRADPGDDLVRVGDVAGLAVDTIRRVQLQVFAGAVGVVFHFINRGGAKELARVAVLADAAIVADVEVGDSQVRGLVFFVMS